MIKVAWTQLKQMINAQSLFYKYAQDDNSYTVSAYDGSSLIAQTVIPFNTSDAQDFAVNWQSNGNANIRPDIVQVLGKDVLTLTPFGAFSDTTLKKGQTVNWDIQLPQTMTLKGAELFSSNAVLGDWLVVTVVDKDNVLGYGGTPDNPTVLGSYVTSWYIAPGMWNSVEDVSISQPLQQGLYMRISYTSVGSATDPQAIVNFFSYVSN